MRDKQQLYSDDYFEKGHWIRKIWQTILAIAGWILAILPIVITGTSIWASYNPKIPHLWSYSEGIYEFKFIGTLLLFAFIVIAQFAVTMTIIQNRKRKRLVEQWPTFNPINQKKRTVELNKFMDRRFGDKEFRENVRNYQVQPEQNLDTDQIQNLFADKKINGLNKD